MIKFLKNHAFVLLCFVLCSCLYMISQVNQVSAESIYKAASTMTPAEQVASYSFYLGLKKCVGDKHYDAEVANFSEIFKNQEIEVSVGYIAEAVAMQYGIGVSGDDGKMWCSTIAETAFKLWGIEDVDNAAVLSGLGYTNKQSYDCLAYYQKEGDSSKKINTLDFSITLPYTLNSDQQKMSPSDKSSDDNSVLNTPDDFGIFCSDYISYVTNNSRGTITYESATENGSPKNYVAVEGGAWTTSAINLVDFIRVNIYDLCPQYSQSCDNKDNKNPSLDLVPPNAKGLHYFLNKYYFENSKICNASARSWGLTSALKSTVGEPEYSNITAGIVYGPYASVDLITDSKGSKQAYSFNMDSENARNNTELPLWDGAITTCGDVKNSLSSWAKTISDDISINQNAGEYTNILNAAGLSVEQSTIPIDDGYVGDDSATTCAIDGVGWLVCPVVNFLASVIDSSWGYLTDFLEVKSDTLSTEKTTDSNLPYTSTYKAWQMVRNIANVVFAIVFLIIIFSQVTSFGISNYGIKKMLPKLIIAAILVNLSFYICQIAVDISNILGYSIKNIFDSMSKELGATSIFVNLPESSTGFSGFGGLAVGALTAVGAGAIVYAQIGTLIPVLLGGIVAVLMVLFMLIGRQALIILLVMLSPLAFVAYLLPNTSKLFDKWKKLFMSLLLLFPIVAIVVGASSLASAILTNVFTSSNNPIGQIAAAAVAVLPLFVVPGMLKKSLDGVGNIGGTLNKLSDKWGKGAGSKWTGSKLNKHIEAERANKSARIQGGVYEGGKYGKYNPNVWRSKLHGKYNQSNMSGKYGDKMSAMGVSQADKFNDENVGLATSRLNSLGLDRARIESIALGEDKEYGSNLAMRQAAIKDMVATNNVGGINKLWDKTIDMDDSQNSKYIRNTFANSLMSSSSRPSYLGGGAVSAMRIHDKSADNGQRTFEGAIRSAIGNNTYSPDKLARADKDEVAELNRVLLSGGFDDGVVERISKNAQIAISDNKFDVNKNIGEIEKIAGLTPETNTDIATSQTAQTITNSSNGQALVDQNGFPLQLNEQQTSGGSNREPIITNNNGVVIKDRRIR